MCYGSCGNKGSLRVKGGEKNEKDRHTYMCSSCNWCKSLFTGSILQGSKLKKNKFIALVYLWLQELDLKKIRTQVGLSENTIGEWNRLFLECICLDMEKKDVPKIGGPGMVVEIDKSKFGKRKYHVS